MPGTTTPPTVDLRALIPDRKSKGARATVRANICFDPDLLAQLTEVQNEKDARESRREDRPEPDQRMGRPDPLAQQLADLEAQVAATTLVAVFRVPTRERQAEINKLSEEGEDVDTLIVQECFTHFLRDGEKVPADELGADDFAAWLDVASRGEVNDIAYRITMRSLGTPDFPASVKRSLTTRR